MLAVRGCSRPLQGEVNRAAGPDRRWNNANVARCNDIQCCVLGG